MRFPMNSLRCGSAAQITGLAAALGLCLSACPADPAPLPDASDTGVADGADTQALDGDSGPDGDAQIPDVSDSDGGDVEADGEVGPPPPEPPELIQELTGLDQEAVLKGVYVAEDGRVVAVGNHGLIAQRKGDGDWAVVADGDGELLNAVHGTGLDDVWAVGIDGLILHGTKDGFGAGSPCDSDADCVSNDPCVVSSCGGVTCLIESSNAPGCCGAAVASWAFDTGTLQGWTVSKSVGGIEWHPANVNVFGTSRASSPPYALHFGDSSLTPPNFDTGVAVQSTITSPPFTLPGNGTASAVFQIFMDTESSSSYDTLSLEALVNGTPSLIWEKGQLGSVPTNGFLEVVAPLDLLVGQTVRLRFTFDSQDSAANSGEGVYLDDIVIETSCGSAGIGAQFPTFWGVHASAPTSAWAVGLGGAIAHWDGVSWSGSASESSTILGIHGHGDAVVMVGAAGRITTSGLAGASAQSPTKVDLFGVHSADGATWFIVGQDGTLIRGDGASWDLVDLSGVGAKGALYGVFARSTDDVYIVGDQATALHWDGAVWTALDLPDSLKSSTLRAVWVDAAGLVTITGDEGVLLQGAAGESLVNIASLAKGGAMHGIWGFDDGTVYMAGDKGPAGSGVLMKYDGSWDPEALPITFHLKDVWGSAPNDVWVVGLAGALMHFDGTNWNSALGVPLGAALHAVWGSGPMDVWAGGDGGLLLHWNGTAWSVAASQTTSNLRAVFGLNPGHAVAVGHKGVIMAYNGIAWATSPVAPIIYEDGSEEPIEDNLFGVGGVAADDLWAVGANGQILHWDGTIWTTEDLGFPVTMRAVHARAANDVLAVGGQGTVLHYNGEGWTQVPTGSIATLYAIDGNAAGDLFIVGDLGTVLKAKAPVESDALPR